MENFVFLAVLFAAACHAGWNALIKVGLDPLSTTTLISIGSGAVALVFIPLVGVPAWAAWPWLVASVAIHLVYFASLIETYRTGDLGQVYPIARGAAPLMTATVTTIFIGEKLSIVGWIGIFALVAGVLLLSARGGRELAHIDRRAIGFAFFTALTVCAYSVVDGVGARLSGNPNAYSVWLFVGIAVVMLPYALFRDGRDVIPAMQLYWQRGIAGGALAISVLWHRDLGDDGGTHRSGRHTARNKRPFRCRHCRRRAEGAAARRSYPCGVSDCLRTDPDTVAIAITI